jgi:hypothetical protein
VTVPSLRLSTAWRAVLGIADALFGPTTPPQHSRRWVARYLGLAGLLMLVVVVRRPDAIGRPQFWAEDGKVFFRQELTLGFWAALATLHGGFPFLAQRLVAALASVAHTVAAPLIYNASSIAITGLTMATFSLPRFRHLVRSDGVRTALCVATICMPAGQELLATPTTVGYFLAIWIVFLSLMRTPRTPAGTGLWCLGGALAVLSTQLATVATPLWLLRAVRGVARRHGPDVAFGATQMAALLLVVGLAGGMAGVAGLPWQSVASPVAGPEWHPAHLWLALQELGWVLASYIVSAFVPVPRFKKLLMLGTPAVVAAALLVAAGFMFTSRDLAARGRVVVCLALYLMVASLYLELAGRPVVLVLLHGSSVPLDPFAGLLGTRHRVLPNLGLLLAAAGMLDGATRMRTRITVLVVCAGLLFAWTPEFRVRPFPDLQWPRWAARLDQKLSSGSPERLVIPSHPTPYFDIVFDSPTSAAPPTRPTLHDAGDQR